MSEMVVEEMVYPGAKLGEVFSCAKKAHLSTCDYLVITAGSNDAYSGKAINVLKNMKSVLMSLEALQDSTEYLSDKTYRYTIESTRIFSI